MHAALIYHIVLFLTGPGQTYPVMHASSGYYNSAPPPQAYPTMTGHDAPPTGKVPVSSTDYSGNYYLNSSGPSSYLAPSGTHPPVHQYSTANTPASGASLQHSVQSYQQATSYGVPAGYYGQQYNHPSQGQTQPSQQQPSMVPASSANNLGAPLYPIVSYPSAPGSSQYGTLRSSQSAPPVSTVMPPPPTQNSLQQYPQGNRATPTSSHTGYSAPPFSQTATINGQSNAGWFGYNQ